MRPTLAARGLKANLLQYLSTTYALADEGARAALEAFLGDETTGMFRGPFLRIRAPFTLATPGWREYLEWAPEGFTPYAHQAIAFRRLSSFRHTPEPTLVTTGTGSGKTESFLIPILDHCRRQRAAGVTGVKAILLYPMNALATDQAGRLDSYLKRDALARVTAGLYIGDTPDTEYERVFTHRSQIRATPPDILITNYKMLDLLLQRAADGPLWRDADLRYVVVDEFHSYDGAQGTDVAMLLRRLAAALGVSEPGRPLGPICPVATSATLASDGPTGGEPGELAGGRDRRDLLAVAAQVFGVRFAPDSIVGEHRQSIEEFIPASKLENYPLPGPEQLRSLADPASGPEALADLVEAVTGTRDCDPFDLGRRLRRHILTKAVLTALAEDRDGTGVRTLPQVLGDLWRVGAYSWGQDTIERPHLVAEALARFVALLSIARDPASTPEHPRPFVQVEVHQWARAVSRLLRGVLPWPKAEFRWDASEAAGVTGIDHLRAAPATTATSASRANVFLPAVYCRECGRSGWAVFSPESDDFEVDVNPVKIRRASTSQDKIRIRNLIAATDAEAAAGYPEKLLTSSRRTSPAGPGGTLMIFDGMHSRLRFPDPVADYDLDADTGTHLPALTTRDSAFVLVNLGDTANTAGREDWCPACGERNAIRYLGTRQAALAAAAITYLFTSQELDPAQGERKTLLFNDSVQDAAHRAGFVANRSYTFSLRALLAAHLRSDAPVALHDLVADVVEATTDPQTLAAVVPPDLHDYRGVARLLSGTGRGGDQRTWLMVGERLAFASIMEFGFASRRGRTLELTRTAAASVRIPDSRAAADLVRQVHLDCHGLPPTPQDDDRYLAFLRVFLERLRSRGAVGHRWLDGYLNEAGTSRYLICGQRKQGMPAYPRGRSAPVFLLGQAKKGSEFDLAVGRLAWYETWVRRCLQLTREQAPDFWHRLLPALVEARLLSSRTAEDKTTQIFGLTPGAIEVSLLDDEQVNTAFVRCTVCSWEQTVHPSQLAQWHGQPCPSYRCNRGRLVAGDRPEAFDVHQRDRDFRADYYRRLYREAGTYQVITAEHTAMLTRAQRERVERIFRTGEGFNAPNVLSCTPTLELGIDVGDLSTVVLASLPRNPANYAQRVGRAGRRTGNAFLLTVPGTRNRDLYFLDQPKEMIGGRITPPGCYLSAVEILRRQYLAHLLDLAASGRLNGDDGVPLRPLPPKAPALFSGSGYLGDLVEMVIADGERLVDGFLALFAQPDSTAGDGVYGISEETARALRVFATGGLRTLVDEAARTWHGRIDELHDRLRAVDEATEALAGHDDTEDVRQRAELQAERRGIGRWLAEIGNTDAQAALTELGLLPNYALIDNRTALDATLYWQEGQDEAGRPVYDSETREYERPQRLAITELAPGNTFYVNGYRHEISGMDIGSAARPNWRTWRVCPDCGYVRTSAAEHDRTACPRCHSNRLADDGSCLHHVVAPIRVTSRDKREDARIRDDRDERDVRRYEIATAVDIPLETITPESWQHTREVFGIDFSRHAMVRTVNLGPRRYDIPPGDDFAGNSVRINPFYVCTGCGAATADGKPVFDHDIDALTSSAARDPKLKHHRPWCPLRRGKKNAAQQIKILLAHELETEAVRVLLPAATVLVEERVHSLRAALRLGIDRHFGGDPDHLDTTIAYMPDERTGTRRSYLVIFDRLPGGTGYLHRLTDPTEFQGVLLAAREALRGCACVGENRRACHRCLYRHTPEDRQAIVSRAEALAIIDALLFVDDGQDGWEVERIAHTGRIGLDRQVESDLEARFLGLLRDWARRSQHAALDEDGHASGHLRIRMSGEVVHWRLTSQQRLDGTRPDFTFTRADGPSQRVHVYLDGHRYHATAEHNTLASDAAKRTRLRADGHTVFQLTWDDLDLFERDIDHTGRPVGPVPVWPPYGAGAQEQAKAACEQYGGTRAELTETVFVDPIRMLLAYLEDPDPERWATRAQAVTTAAILGAGTVQIAAAHRCTDLAAGFAAALSDCGRRPGDIRGGNGGGGGPCGVFLTSDDNGLQLVVAMDATNPDAIRWSALAVLDDTTETIGVDGHKRRWRAWLCWSNLTQFLAITHADGVQLTTSQIVGYPVDALAICGRGATRIAPGVFEIHRDQTWDTEILPYLDEDEADLASLAHHLADRGKRAPVFGFELGDSGWPADFAWLRDDTDIKIAVVHEHAASDEETRRRDAAYATAGWTARTASAWLEDLDTLLAMLPDTEGHIR